MTKYANYSFSVIFCIFTIFLRSSITNASKNLVPGTCKKISESDPTVKYDYCVSLLGSDPRSSRATTLAELGSISFEIDISKAKSMVSTINGLLKDPAYDPVTKSDLKDCLNFYSDAPDDLQESLDALKREDYSTANIRASAALDSSVNCEDQFKGKLEVFPVEKENYEFYQITAVSLAFTVLL